VSNAGKIGPAASEIIRGTIAAFTRPENPTVIEDTGGIAGGIPRVPFAEFKRIFQWEQGEHITLIGPTGYGKTTLARELLKLRKYIITFGTKPEDKTLDGMIAKDGFTRIESFDEIPAEEGNQGIKVILWPTMKDVKSADDIIEKQKELFREALFTAFRQGRWCIFLDELRYITDRLNLKSEAELIWEQGRSAKVSLVAGYQRPRNIPLLAYDQPEHLVFFKETDLDNLRRMADIISWIDRAMLIDTISHLPKYDFVYLNKPTETAIISRVEQ
jgi:hypothetical protein